MIKKDYELLAEVFRGLDRKKVRGLDYILNNLCEKLKRNNFNFNEDRFIEACKKSKF